MKTYIAVLKRAIPVNDYSVDTLTHICTEHETVESVMEWAEKSCAGSAAFISLEITEAS
jgi:hypothetical protein